MMHCMLCGGPINGEEDDYQTVTDHGPLGLGEPVVTGFICDPCFGELEDGG